MNPFSRTCTLALTLGAMFRILPAQAQPVVAVTPDEPAPAVGASEVAEEAIGDPESSGAPPAAVAPVDSATQATSVSTEVPGAGLPVAPVPLAEVPGPAVPAPSEQPSEENRNQESGDKKRGKKKSKDQAPWELAPPKLSGFIQVHFRHAFATGVDSQVDYDDFRVQRVRLAVKGAVFPWLIYDVEVDPRAPELAGILRDAFVGFKIIPGHVIRVGQQKTQFGYENVESSTRLYAVNRTEVSDNLSRGQTLRDVGVGVIGNVKLGGGFRIEEAATLVNGAGMNVQSDDTPGKDFWGRLGLRYKKDRLGKLSLRLGASAGLGDHIDPGDDALSSFDDFRTKFKRLGADLEIDQKWFFLSSEYVLGWDQNMTTHERDEPLGYYVNLVGKTPWHVGPIARYDALGDGYKRWTVGAFYGLADERFRVLLNYEYRSQKDGVRSDDKLYAWLQTRF